MLTGLGGEDGALVIDLMNMKDFSMDTNTWQATIGGGTKLSDLTKKLHDNGKRAISHGTCPGVGIGGHATIVSVLSRFTSINAHKGLFLGRTRSIVTHVGFMSGSCRGSRSRYRRWLH